MTTIRLHGQDPAASETVSFSVIVKLPKTYRYDVDPDLLYTTVVRTSPDGHHHRSGGSTGSLMNGDWYAFTPAGDTAVRETWSSDRAFKSPGQADSSSTLVERIVYWQPVPGKKDKFMFVSSTGFATVAEGRMFDYDKAPDNIIDEGPVEEVEVGVFWIWRNGARERFKR